MGNTFDMNTIPNIVLIPIPCDLDVSETPAQALVINDFIDRGAVRIVLNCARVSYIDSCGMAMLWQLIRRLRARGGALSFVHVRPEVVRAFKRCRMLDFVSIKSLDKKFSAEAFEPKELPERSQVIQIDRSDLARTRARVREVLMTLPFDEHQMFDLLLAIGEAVGNAVDHSESDCSMIKMSMYSDRVIVDITDCGCGYEVRCMEDLEPMGDESERGRGVHLMALLVDGLSIGKRLGHAGTRVHLVKLYKTSQDIQNHDAALAAPAS